MAKRRGLIAELGLSADTDGSGCTAQHRATFNALMAQQAAERERWQREAEERRAASEAEARQWAAVRQQRAAEFDALEHCRR